MFRVLFLFLYLYRVPTVPVKNLNGSSPVHPALAGEKQYANTLIIVTVMIKYSNIWDNFTTEDSEPKNR